MMVGACNPETKPDNTPSGSNDPGATPSDSDAPADSKDPDSSEDPSQPSTFEPESWYETNYWERSDREKAGLRGPVLRPGSSSMTNTETGSNIRPSI